MKLKNLLLMCGLSGSILVANGAGTPPPANVEATDARSALSSKERLAQFPLPRQAAPACAKCDNPRRGAHYVPRLLVNNISRTNFGIYALEPSAGAEVPEWEIINAGSVDGSAQLRANFGGVFKDGAFHCIGGSDYGATMFIMHYTEWDAATWECHRNERIQNRAFMAADLTVDPTTGRVYGYFSNEEGDGQEFGWIDYGELLRHTISVVDGEKMTAIAADSAGQLFATSLDGNLYRIDKSTGDKTLVGDTAVELEDMNMTAAFDPATGILYWIAACPDGTRLYTIDTATGAATLIQYLGTELYTSLTIEESRTNADAPAGVEEFSADFNHPSTTGTVTFKLPLTTYMGEPLSGELSYRIASGDGTVLAQGDGMAGETVAKELSLSAGPNTLCITVSGRDGDSPEMRKEVWAGPDEPSKVTNLNCAATPEGIVVSWDAPQTGIHSGYLDPAALTYKVVRHPSETVVADGVTATTVTDAIEHEGMKSYSYTVTPYNGSLKGEDAESEICVAGSSFQIPYFEDFLTQQAFNTYTVADADGDGTTWQWVDNDARPYGGERETFAGIYINAADMEHVSDDRFISPAVALEAGKSYELKFNAAGFAGADDWFDVLVGRGDDYGSYATVMQDVHLNDNVYKAFSHTLDVTEGGDYHVVFRFKSSGATNGFMMKLRDVGIDMKQNGAESPAAVGALAVTPDATGLHNVDISFTAPDKTMAGGALRSLDRIVVTRTTDNVRVKTFTTPRPGEELRLTDTEVPGGWNSYTVTPYSSGTKGEDSSATVYVGEDIPLAPTSINLTDNLDGTATLSWKSPGNIGVDGHVVNEAKLTYNVYYSSGELYESGLTETSLTFTGVPQDGLQQLAKLLVSAVTTKGEGAKNSSNAMVTGAPYSLPYYESFPCKMPQHDFYWQEGNGEIMFQLTDAMSADSDDGSIFWTSAAENLYQTFLFGKMSVKDCDRPMLTFAYHAAPDFDIMLDAGYLSNTGEETVLQTVDYKDLLGKSGWRKAVVDLSALKNAEYFIPFVRGYGEGAMSHSVILDDFRFLDSKDYDVELVPAKTSFDVLCGDKVQVDFILRNSGAVEIKDCKAAVCGFDGSEPASQMVTVPPYSDAEVTLCFEATPAMAGTQQLTLKAACAGDPDSSNDVAQISLKVGTELLPEPASLTAKVKENGVELSWEAPEGDGEYMEDFERYPVWATSNLGKWSILDADDGRNYGFATLENIPNQYGYTAFTVFSPEAAGIDLPANPAFAPASGSKYLFNWSSELSTMAQGYSDDWLISPELSGEAQTISFSLSNFWDYRAGEAEVLYSKSGTAKGDFVRLARITPNAGFDRYDCTLPAGARYFAIELLAADKGAMGVDDVLFKPLFRKVIGYAVYRDGVRLAQLDASTLRFTDTAANGDHNYSVAAIYGMGESTDNPSAEVKMSAVPSQTFSGLRVETGRKSMTVFNPQEETVEVYTVQGVLVKSSQSSVFTLGLESGVYLVKGKDRIVEILIK